MSNSGSETQTYKTNFASRLLQKELTGRKRSGQQIAVMTAAEAVKYAPGSEQEEKVLVGRP